MANIINEMPDDEIDVTMEGEELEVDLEVKGKPGKSTSDVERVVQAPKQEELN
jgi:hypothetical protein